MAREIASVHQFENSHREFWQLRKDYTVIRCEDGTVYEFQKPDGRPSWELSHAVQPDGERTHTGARVILPDAVEETVSTLFEGWSK